MRSESSLALRTRRCVFAVGLLLLAACDLAPQLVPEGIQIDDETGLVTRYEHSRAIPQDVPVGNIEVRNADEAQAVDIFWWAVPCQPGAIVTVRGTADDMAVIVKPEPSLATIEGECAAEAQPHALRLFLSQAVDERNVHAQLVVEPARD